MTLSLPYPIDPSLPSNPSPVFSDTTAARGDHLRANNAEIWANFSYIISGIDSLFPPGIVIDYAGVTIPGTFWMNCTGASISRSTYSACWANLNFEVGTCTISHASPAVVTKTGHGLQSGDCINFTTTGTLPSPLSVETNYYITKVNANTFKLSSSFTNYLAGTFINTTTDGSGTHDLHYVPWGVVDANNFNIPDFQGIGSIGSGQQSAASWASVNYVGRLGQYIQDQSWKHFHNPTIGATAILQNVVSGGQLSQPAAGTLIAQTSAIGAATNDGTHGDPRGSGFITQGPVAGINKIIRVL